MAVVPVTANFGGGNGTTFPVGAIGIGGGTVYISYCRVFIEATYFPLIFI
jgi:hypothetical protein